MNRDRPLLSDGVVTLRALAVQDAEALHEIHRDEETHRYWSGPPHPSLDYTRRMIETGIAREDARGWAILVENRLIGRIALMDVREGVAETGLILHRNAAGKGYARRALALMVAFAFSDGYHRLMADIDPENAASLRLFERAGFQREGHLRQNWVTHLGVRDSVVLAKLKDTETNSS